MTKGKTMLDFTLTEEQRNIRDLAHDFAEKEMRPVAWEYDRDATWPQEIIETAWEVGLMNTQLPEKCGGAGATLAAARRDLDPHPYAPAPAPLRDARLSAGDRGEAADNRAVGDVGGQCGNWGAAAIVE